MKYPLIDPTFTCLQHEPPTPGSVGIVRSVSGSTAQVSFQGRTVSARFPAAGTLASGDSVSVVCTDGMWWALKASAGYPSRYPRPLADFNSTNPAGVLLAYLLKDNPRTYTYRACVVLAVLSASLLSISLEGRPLTVGVEYAGVAQTTTGISKGDTVLAYQKNPGSWVALAKVSTPAAAGYRLTWVWGSWVGWGNYAIGAVRLERMSSFTAPLSPAVTEFPIDFNLTPIRPNWSVNASSICPYPGGGYYDPGSGVPFFFAGNYLTIGPLGKYRIPAGEDLSGPRYYGIEFTYSGGGGVTADWSNPFMLGENGELLDANPPTVPTNTPVPFGSVIYPNPLHF